MNSVDVACLQLSPQVGEFDDNCARATEAIATAAADGVDLIVVPELVTSGYVLESMDEARALAITPDHQVFADWAAAAGGAVVVGGFAEQGTDGLVYNSAAVLDRDGVLAVYRKVHLWDTEKRYFTPGDAAPPVLATRVGRLGVLICYDLEFPEMTRGLARAGAEILAVPTNWPLVPHPDGEHAPEVVIAMAAARVNKVFIACCDRAGVERGQDWTQGTAIVGAEGWVLSKAEPTPAGYPVARAVIEPAQTWDKAISPANDLFQDRRPEVYTRLDAAARASG